MRDWPWYGHVLVAVLIFGLFYLAYYRPKDKDLEAVREQRIEVEHTVQRLKQKKQQLDEIEAELQAMNATLKNLEAIIPHKEEIDVILRRIQQMAFDSRINIVSFVPNPLIDQEFFSEKPITMQVSGNYHNLALFFNRLGNFSRLFTIEDFAIKAIRDQSEATTITADLTAKTYIFLEEETQEKKPPSSKKRGDS
ncbi:MAG: type 4a pilus biogenesis protein PilO [Candidatus Aminicenantes bacterium]